MWQASAALDESAILAIWVQGRGRHAAEVAAVILAIAQPQRDWSAITQLPIGVRDAEVLRLRGATFGSKFWMEAACSSCGERMEFDATMEELLKSPEAAAEIALDLPRGQVSFRLPDSLDMAMAAQYETVAQARAMIARRCMIGGTLSDPISEASLQAISDAMRAADPQSAIAFVMKCPACETPQRFLIDTGLYVFHEICEKARAILDDVLEIALAFGWSEADVLAIPAARRQHYLSRIPRR